MKSILLTGASGFVGKNLTDFIQRTNLGVVELLSLRKPLSQQLPEVQTIIHLAGKAHDVKNASDASEYFRINTELTKQLFDLFLESNARDFIYFSSVKAVADMVPNILVEDTKPAPGTPYGESKLRAEQYILAKTLPKAKRVFILRPCMIHGPGNKGNLNLLYKIIKKGIPYPLGEFDNRRSFLSIDNLLFILEKIILNPEIQGGVYNLADDEALPTTEVIRIMSEATGNSPRIWKIPAGLIKGIARTGDILHLPLSSERLKKLTESYVVSNEKIKKEIGITELPVSVRKGLYNTIASFR